MKWVNICLGNGLLPDVILFRLQCVNDNNVVIQEDEIPETDRYYY